MDEIMDTQAWRDKTRAETEPLSQEKHDEIQIKIKEKYGAKMSKIPKEIWLAGSPNLDINGANSVHLAISGNSFTQSYGATLEKYHHDSVVQGLERQNTDLQKNNTKLVLENRVLKDRIATLENMLKGDCKIYNGSGDTPYTRPRIDWWWLERKLKEKRITIRKMEECIKALEKQLERKVHDC